MRVLMKLYEEGTALAASGRDRCAGDSETGAQWRMEERVATGER